MVPLLLAISLALSAPFGEANAEGAITGSGRLLVTLSVQVEGVPTTVVAHVIDADGEAEIVTLAPIDDRYTAAVEVRSANYGVVFEALYLGGASLQSEWTTLLDLGLDSELLQPEGQAAPVPSGVGVGESDRTPASGIWVWLALAAGAGSMVLLVSWFLIPMWIRRRIGRFDKWSVTPDNTATFDHYGDEGLTEREPEGAGRQGTRL